MPWNSLVLRFSNRCQQATRRRINTATLAWILTGILMALAPAGLSFSSVARAADLDAPRLDDGHVDQLYHMVEEWVRAGKAPAMARPIRVTGLGGIKITLRWLGLTVGVAELRERDIVKTPQGSADLAAVALKATGEALTQVGQSVRQRGREGGNPFLDLTSKLLVDIQVANLPEPLRIDDKADELEIFRQFASGYHGLVMSKLMSNGQMRESWNWPATALAMSTDQSQKRQLLQMLSDLGYPIVDLERVGRPGGPPLQRFTIRHMVRPQHDQQPVMLVRGNVILPLSALDGDGVKDLSHKLAITLLQRMKPEGGMVGTHLPVNGMFEPATASDEEQALATYVLTRWALWMERHSLGDKSALAAVSAVHRGIDRLWGKPANKAPDILRSPAVVALSLLTLTDSPVLVERKPLRDDLAAKLLAMQAADGSFHSVPEDKEPFNRPNHALVMAALTHYYDRTRDPAYGAAVRKASDWFWARPDSGAAVRALPWVIDAELRMAKLLSPLNVEAINAGAAAPAPRPDGAAKPGAATAPAGPVKLEPWPDRVQKLSELLIVLQDRQIVRAPQGANAGPADVVGGFDLVGTPMGVPPNPGWDSALPLTFVSASLRDPRIVPPKSRVATLLTCGLGARFIAQLMYEPTSLYYARSPEDCLGGVRMAMWDNRLTNAAQGMALLSLVELLDSLDVIDQQGGLSKP